MTKTQPLKPRAKIVTNAKVNNSPSIPSDTRTPSSPSLAAANQTLPPSTADEKPDSTSPPTKQKRPPLHSDTPDVREKKRIRTKSKSKAIILQFDDGQEKRDYDDDIDGFLNLNTCLEESGGLDQFQETPCTT